MKGMQIYDNSRCKSYTRSKRIIGIPQKYSGTADHHRSAHPDNPCEEIDYIRQTIGKEPKLRGFELLGYSPNINYADASPECLTEVEENKGTVETALQWARANRQDKVNDTGTENSTDYATGGILTFSFHWFSPLGGRDKSFYTEHTDFDATKVLQEGTPERAAFYADMDVIADILRRFQDENIPILWRPFHESYGTWFWWGAKGAKVARDLYRLMFDYYATFPMWIFCKKAESPGPTT